MTRLVFDTTALSHFARAGRTETLRILVADDESVLLAEVATELARGVSSYPSLGNVTAGGVAIIDDAAARAIGNRESLQVRGTPWLLIRGFKTGALDRATIEATVDDLIGTGMRLPFSTGSGLFT